MGKTERSHVARGRGVKTLQINSIYKRALAGMGCIAILLFSITQYANAAPNPNGLALKSASFISLPNNKVRIRLQFNHKLGKAPNSFAVKNLNRLVFDFSNTLNAMPADQSQRTVDVGVLDRFKVLQAEQRTRVVLQLKELVSYSLDVYGSRVNITLSGGSLAGKNLSARRFPTKRGHHYHAIRDVQFTSGAEHTAKIIVKTSDNDVSADIQRDGKKVILSFVNTSMPSRLRKRLDVRDFGTPARTVDSFMQGNQAKIVVSNRGDYEYFLYQVDRKLVLEVKPVSFTDQSKVDIDKRVYRGKRISLNFQDIKVRAVLQLLADFTKLNIVVSDSVAGNITLRLNRVPWDQALDIILRTRGLDKRQFGSVILVAPATEIASQEKAELKAQRETDELEPLTSDLVQVNYAKATTLASLMKDKTNSLLSARGNVSVDERTNTLWVQDIPARVQEVKALVHKLDVPVRQVLIEARVVNIQRNYERDLGVRFGISNRHNLSGTLEGAETLRSTGSPATGDNLNQRLNVNLPAVFPQTQVPSIGLALARLGSNTFLDLELSALEAEDNANVISSPRLTTANQQAALIESGEEVPFQEATASGATAITFKKAVLSLKVTPQITPDNKIVLTLEVNQDTVSDSTSAGGVPIIDTNKIQTNVLVDNGETIVLGGIYAQNTQHNIKRIPFLGSIPGIGALFRTRQSIDDRSELLIFVTPRIVEKSYNGHIG